MINLLFSLLLLGPLAFAAPRHSILQGSTSESVTHFTVVALKSQPLTFRAVNVSHEELHHPIGIQRVDHEGSRWEVYRLRFEGLNPERDYILEVFDEEGELRDERNFRTLDTSRESGRMALVSCTLRQFHNPFMWKALNKPENRPDVIAFLGDTVYLDRDNILFKRTPKTTLDVWNSFIDTRNAVDLYFWRDLVPIISVWDDHDSGGDNVDAKFEMMQNIRPIFDTFFANDPIEGTLEWGPALAKRFTLFGKNFIMLDGRSFRGLDEASPVFAMDQELWMLDQVRPGPNFLLSGSQFYGKYIQKDSVEHDAPERARKFTERLAARGREVGATFAFGSGDIHFSEVQALEPELLGYPTVEITSSSAHSTAFPGHYILKPHNPRRTHVTGTHNVVILDFPSGPGFEFDVRSLGWRGNTLFATHVSLKGPCEELLSR